MTIEGEGIRTWSQFRVWLQRGQADSEQYLSEDIYLYRGDYVDTTGFVRTHEREEF